MAGKLMTADEAVGLVGNNDVVSVCGIVGALAPDKTLAALEERFMETGSPRDLTVVFPVAVGDMYGITGMDRLAHEGLIKRLIGGSYVTASASAKPPKIYEMIINNKVEAYNFPMGVLMHLHRDIAAKRPGLITEVGLKTFVDPRINGAKMNETTKEDLVEVIELNNKEYLFYKAYPVNVAIIRGTTADEDGNITMEHEVSLSLVVHMAMAAHNSGGKVIAQVKRVTARGTLNPQLVKVPGILVDAIVIDEDQKQATGIDYDPAASGEMRAPLAQLEKIPLGVEKVLIRRAMMALGKDYVVNLGFGIPSMIPRVALEEGIIDKVTFTTEHGSVGGVPLTGLQFGGSINPQAMIESPTQFDFLDGAGINAACLAFAEVDGKGNVNVSQLSALPHVLAGVGGFIDIVHNVKKIVYCGTLNAGGVKVDVKEGKVKIIREGRITKFVGQVQQLTFNGAYAAEKGQDVIYITERCVFRLGQNGLTLIEVAPGIDVEKDIAKNVDFKFKVADDLKEMDARIFKDDPMGLKESTDWTDG
jgi:propionate CoA-transferase